MAKDRKKRNNYKLDPAYWLSRIHNSSESFKAVPEEIKTVEFYFKAVNKTAWALEYVPESLKTEAMCVSCVKRNALMLEYVPESFKTESMCHDAVKENSWTLKYVPEALKTESICLTAVKNNGRALEYVPESLKTEVICLAAVNETPEALKFVSEDLQVRLIPAYTIRLTDDEIDIINIWAKLICDNNNYETLEINETIRKEDKVFLIDTISQSRLIYTRCVSDSYYRISHIEFSEKNTKANLYCAMGSGPFSGTGWIAIFSKENNIWKQTDEKFHLRY